MAFRDVLLVLIAYPRATDPAQIAAAVSFAAHTGAHLSAALCIVKIRGEPLSDAFIDVPALGDDVAQGSKAGAELTAGFELLARNAGVYGESLTHACDAPEAADWLAREARLHDLTVVPAIAEDDTYRAYAESVIFGSGRSVLVLPPRPAPEFAPGRIAIAWDGSRAAARAVADALPLLEWAQDVQILTVVSEAEMESGASAADQLAASLKRRGIAATPEPIGAARRSAGEVLMAELPARQADLLVMGAYGHSRLREFILGGATRSLLANPPLPLFLSH